MRLNLVRDSVRTVRVLVCQLGFGVGQLGFWFGLKMENPFLVGKLGERFSTIPKCHFRAFYNVIYDN